MARKLSRIPDPHSPAFSEPRSALLTDSYQLAMIQSYLAEGLTAQAVFEFFVRKLPAGRNFLLAAGLEQLLDYLEELHFEESEIQWLRQTGRYSEELLMYLARFRFSGDVFALEEGTPVFADEPIVRVIAPLPEAQLIESRLINLVHFQTLIASKAARCALAAPDKLLVDFGMRRAHGFEAALLAARASYIGGFSGTSTVLASKLLDIPMYGTMAHSFIQAHPSEELAFERFAETQSGSITLLLDTYDTEKAAIKAARLACRLLERGIVVQGVRLDSGDLAQHARNVRAILDEHGLGEMHIFASGGLDEYDLKHLLQAPIDGFGVGTKLTVSADAPSLDCAYKLEEYNGRPTRKTSEGKATWPGAKRVCRFRSPSGSYIYDSVELESEPWSDEGEGGESLLKPVMREGRRLGPTPPLSRLRDRALQEIARLPAPLRSLEPASEPYRVEISSRLHELAGQLDLRVA